MDAPTTALAPVSPAAGPPGAVFGRLVRLGAQVVRVLGYRSRRLDTSVGQLNVWSADGAGPLPHLLLFHGFGASALHWVPLLQQLRPHVRGVTALDLPAHGLSDRPAALTPAILRDGVLEALDALHRLEPDRGPMVVIGNSLGGAAGLRYLNARPERVLGAVLFSPAGAPMDEDELATLRGVFRLDAHADAVRFVRLLHGKPVGLRAHVLAPMLRSTLSDPLLRGWLDRVSPEDFLAPDEVRAVQRPVRVVWGDRERILPARCKAFWREHLPAHSELDEPAGFGHSPFLDDRGWTARQITAFAARVG